MVIQREMGIQVLVKRRVLYIGSSVPLETTEGLEAVQQPLRDRYPCGENADVQGIDSWLSILTSGIQVQYVDDPDTVVFFPITSLTLCAAVRPVTAMNGATGEVMSKFVSLNSDIAAQNAKNPAIFTAITRRVKGRKVLECHGFLCASDHDALEIVKCTSMADQSKRQNGTVKNGPGPFRVANGPPVSRSRPGSYRFVNDTGPPSMMNGSINKSFMTDRQPSARQSVRLSAGEQFPTQIEDVPQEFFDSPPPQGYFYRPNNVQAKNFKVEKKDPQPPLSARSSYLQPAERVSPPSPPTPPTETVPAPKPTPSQHVQQPSPVQPEPPSISEPQPNAQEHRPPPPPENGHPQPPRQRYFMPPRPGAPFYPPPPPPYARPPYYYPPPPPPMGRPRFFSPPPYMRIPPYPYPYPYGPVPPYFRRRRPKRRESESPKSKSSRSGSKHSRNSSRRSQKEETERKRIPNADLDSESDFSFRPRTPPRDYDFRNGDLEPPKKERMSRREEYEHRRNRSRKEEDDDISPPRMMYSGFRPYYMYQPQAFGPYMPPDMSRFQRSSSVPPHLRYTSKDRKNEKKKNKKKNKEKNKQKRGMPPHYGPYGPREDNSMESASMMGGYASEIPQGAYPMDGYYFYPQKPPRDFRREKNQFLNEKSFSRRVQEEQRMAKGKKQDYYPTAYELNDAGADERLNEPDFTMY